MTRTRVAVIASAIVLTCTPHTALSAQARSVGRGGGSSGTSRVVSPAVVASWRSHINDADGNTTTLLVLWRGTPGWFSKGGSGGGSGGGGGTNARGSWAYQTIWEGGFTFTLAFDDDARIVKMLDQSISLRETNVVLVDFVDSANGPTIVGRQWIEPSAQAPATSDAIASIIKRTPGLFEYLRCDLEITDPMMKTMMTIVCGQMRP